MGRTGVFTSLGNESNLDDGKDDFLILKADVSDPDVSKAAATSFLLEVKKFHQNQTITVEGNTSSLGTVRTILMTNASPSQAVNFALLGGSKKSKKKAGSAKKTAKSGSKKATKVKGSKKTTRKSVANKGAKTKRRKSASKAARKNET